MKALFIAFTLITATSCRTPQTPRDQREPDSNQAIQIPESSFSKLLGIDSIVYMDKFFLRTTIDSISTSPISFNAKYLSCAKASVHLENYAYLAKTANLAYERIRGIHTQHILWVDGIEGSFNGIGRFNCYETQKGAPVDAFGKVYSMYFSRNLIGRIIILDSIRNAPAKSASQKQ